MKLNRTTTHIEHFQNCMIITKFSSVQSHLVDIRIINNRPFLEMRRHHALISSAPTILRTKFLMSSSTDSTKGQ